MELHYTFLNVYCHHKSGKTLTEAEIKEAPTTLSRIIDVNNKQHGSIHNISVEAIEATVYQMLNESIFNLLGHYDLFFICVSCDGECRWL